MGTSSWDSRSRLEYCRSSCGHRHLIGIDPDYRVHVGPFLEFGVTGISGTLIDRPNRIEKRPARDRLGDSVRAILRRPHSLDRTERHAEEDADCCDK
jgi:hypothetical protein